jgi:hypothetical protein
VILSLDKNFILQYSIVGTQRYTVLTQEVAANRGIFWTLFIIWITTAFERQGTGKSGLEGCAIV